MSFATPFALAWAALTVPIVVFYILKIRLRQVPVSTTIFWQQIFDEKRPRSLWQQLRHWLSLLVQLLWCILLVLALAEPYFNWEILQARRLILVIDNSASMNATDVSPTRLEAAKKAASRLVTSLRFRDEVAVITAGTQPHVVCGLTGHERTLLAAISSITRSDGPTLVADAIELGKRLLGDTQHGQVIVYSDGGFAGSEKLAEDKLVRLEAIGTKAPNVGITNFQVRRSLLDPVGYEILVEIVNASAEAAPCRLDLDLNGSPVDVFPLSLKPGEVWSQTLEKTSVEGGRLTAHLTPDDALAADNKAAAILPKRTMQKVQLFSPGNLFLQKALEANSLVELKAAKDLPKQFPAGSIHVFHRHVPKQLPPGQVLVIDPVESCDYWQAAGPLENPIVTKQDTESPLMRHVRLDNIILPQARKLTPRAGAHTLVSAVEGEPLYFSIEEPGRKVLVLTVNLDEGDLTFRTAFPIMVTNALGWFASQSGELRESLIAGAISEIELPAREKSAPPLLLRSPGGKERPLPTINSKVSVGPLDEVGVWTITETPANAVKTDLSREPVLELACNLAAKSESNLSIPESWQTPSVVPVAAASWFVRPIWFYLAACAWFVAIGEWFLYQRRWIS
jgi:hypothetical protein